MTKVDHGWQERAPKPHLPPLKKGGIVRSLDVNKIVVEQQTGQLKARIAELEGALREAAGSLEKAGWDHCAERARKVLDRE